MTIDSTITFRCRNLFEINILKLTSNFETTKIFIKLTNKIDFDNSNFIDVIKKLTIKFLTLTNFFATFVIILIDFDNSDFNNVVKKLLINNLTSTNSVIFEITIINIIFIKNCLFFDIINNNFRK